MANKQEKLHATAIKRFERLESKERAQRKLAVEDIKFAQTEDGQWDDGAKEKRKNRPRFTINRVAGAVDQLIGDQRQNRTNIKIRPVSGGASEDVAKTMTGLIRNIEADSKASNAYDTAFDEVVNGGFGGWRVITEFSDDDAFDQDIKIKPLNTATTSLWFDDSAIEYDKRDSSFAFVTVDMPKEEHKERFPKSVLSNWTQEDLNNSSCSSWAKEDTVRVAEYWVKTPVTRNIALLSDGRVIDSDEESSVMDELKAQGLTVKKTRSVKSHKVEMFLLDGAGVLEGPKAWAGKFIPLIPMYGRQSHVEGQTYTRGIVRFAKDANRIYNYETSSVVETNSLTPKDPLWYTPAQAKGHESKYRNFATQNSPFMPYNPDTKTGGGPPIRGGAPAVQQASLQILQQCSMDLYHVTGMQPPSIGVNPELKSGKAIQAQEKQGDRGSFIFTDNLSKSIDYCGEILVDLIPRIYDTARQVRIMQQDGETENVEINTVNQEVIDEQTGKKVLVNDLSIGKYDVVTETGPAFATQRQESAKQILELISSSPQFEALAMDLVAKDLPILETKELTKRVRKVMIQNGTIEPTDEEAEELGLNEPQQADPQQTAITDNIAMQTEKLMADISNTDAKTAETLVKAQGEAVDAYKVLLETYEKQVSLGIPLSEADRALIVKQRDIVAESQQALDEGPNSEQAADLVGQAIQQEQQQEQIALSTANNLTQM
ncbi:MAG: putative portal protein [Prokaryotic dsDNA virus sp.]|nr:MAG: putative portal protein [Prokaryotic dsDNA virus sp.]|tara:strand:+ start:15627 stop:17771 length:2145 start_codon:yes stop_codon:yes gene_type:complete